MNILPKTDLDFDQLAGKVTESFFSGESSLTDGVIKVAQDLELNPEQTRRLVEKTNTIATVRMLKTAQDRKAEFALAGVDEVLNKTHSDKEDLEISKEASEQAGPAFFPNRRKDRRFEQVSFPRLEKVASEAPENPLPAIFRLERDLAALKQEKLASELKAQDGLDFLISEFSKYKSPDFSKFAGEAVTLFGETAELVLPKMAEYLNEKPDLEKVAYVVDDSTVLLQKFAGVVNDIHRIAELGSEIGETQQKLENSWRAAKDGPYKNR